MAALTGGGANLWAAASGSNFSVDREAFLAVGGFDPAIDINEHRELAYRLCAQGMRMGAAPDARSYHLTHRTGWRDPLTENGWEQRFRARHPEAPIDALKIFWASLSREGPATAFFAP
jgi:GT2 family glycosyltransferase